MPFFDTHPAATADARDVAAALDAALGRAEIDIYSSTAGILERAADLEAAARRAGLASRARRAVLLRSDALSRRGDLGRALDLQVDVLAAAERSGDRAICARAQCLLASTYERLADLARSQAAAEASVRLLEAADPPAWHAEHTMVLALFTSFRRRSTVDFTTFDEATRLARTVGDPRLLVAVLNNYAWSALDSDEATGLLVAEQLHAVVAGELGGDAPSAVLDTLACARLAAGRIEETHALAEAAITRAHAEALEPELLPVCLLTAAAVHRAAGRDDDARACLHRARAIALDRDAPEPAAMALKQLSDLAAAASAFENAYRLLAQHLEEIERYRSERSERHAATLQALYGTRIERERRIALERLADTDALTELWNRRYLDRRLRELTRAGRPLAVALVDIDHFKSINDRFSHDAGDAVLVRVADILRFHAGAEKEAAFAARLGGEEFVVVMPDVDRDGAVRRCEAVRAHVQSAAWHSVGAEAAITVSVGLALGRPGDDPSALLGRADAKLYEAKRGGRNRVDAEGGPSAPAPAPPRRATRRS